MKKLEQNYILNHLTITKYVKKRMIPTNFKYIESSEYDDEIEEEKEFDIDIAMNEAYNKNKDKILAESIRSVANGIFAYYNSLNILVGNQGRGKTHIMLRDIIQISRLKDCNFHLIVYISKNGSINDSTFEAQQELIQLPIQVISDSNAEKYLKELDLYKELFDKYCNTPKITIDNNKLNSMFEFLHVNKLNKPNQPLNTIILCEDFVKSKLIKSAYFTNYITQLRHKHSIVYINIQFFKSISTDYKNNATTFFIFSGYSRQKLQYIYQQVSLPIMFDELWRYYVKMKNHDFILVNVRENTIKFIRV
ncbi:hypothetical protein [uncultured Brachyspira sp.]|uniref:hypothetical protein n=1 Tax=uncultured Brachyspira sp. TaxID=221953 RepID=UPI0025FD68B8|nr:hypothetical protein [uncultured Brachyspira sp.]